MAKTTENGDVEEFRVLLAPNDKVKITSSTQTDLDLKSSLWNTFTRHIRISWINLRYEIEPNLWQRLVRRKKSSNVVFRDLCGSFSSGQLSAIMGPSGAGKSCLLGCLSCQRTKGVSGSLRVIGTDALKLAIIPQDDKLLPEFTVMETLRYASRLKNHDYTDFDHQRIIDSVVASLKLESCVYNPVKVRFSTFETAG